MKRVPGYHVRLLPPW